MLVGEDGAVLAGEATELEDGLCSGVFFLLERRRFTGSASGSAGFGLLEINGESGESFEETDKRLDDSSRGGDTLGEAMGDDSTVAVFKLIEPRLDGEGAKSFEDSFEGE